MWMSDREFVVVFFDQAGRVMRPEVPGYIRGERELQGPLDNLLWRAKRQWRTWFPGKRPVTRTAAAGTGRDGGPAGRSVRRGWATRFRSVCRRASSQGVRR